MKRGIKLVKKFELLLKQLNCRSYLHHFGPKKYKLKHHLFALVAMQALRLSLRRVEYILKIFGIKAPTYSALCKSRKKIPTIIWQKLISMTAGLQHENVAIDATGFSRTNPSQHYLRRCFSNEYRKGYAKMSALYDIERRKIIALKIGTKPRHDVMDVKHLLRNQKMNYLLADKGYDAEFLYKICYKKGIKTIIPVKKKNKRGFYRKLQMKNYSEEKYHQRSLIESGFSAIKRKYGNHVNSKSLISINSELSCKALACNLELKH
jgi:transposase